MTNDPALRYLNQQLTYAKKYNRPYDVVSFQRAIKAVKALIAAEHETRQPEPQQQSHTTEEQS